MQEVHDKDIPVEDLEILANYNIRDMDSNRDSSFLSHESVESFLAHNPEVFDQVQPKPVENSPISDNTHSLVIQKITETSSFATDDSSQKDNTEDTLMLCNVDEMSTPNPTEELISGNHFADTTAEVNAIIKEVGTASNINNILDPKAIQNSTTQDDFGGETADPKKSDISCNETVLNLEEPSTSTREFPQPAQHDGKMVISVPDYNLVQNVDLHAVVSDENSDDCMLLGTVMAPLSADNFETLANMKIEGQERGPLRSIINESMPKSVTSGLRDVLRWPGDDTLEKKGKKRSRKSKNPDVPTVLTSETWIKIKEEEEEEKKRKLLQKKIKAENAQKAKKIKEEQAFKKKQEKLEKEKIRLQKEQEKLEKQQAKAAALAKEIEMQKTIAEWQKKNSCQTKNNHFNGLLD